MENCPVVKTKFEALSGNHSVLHTKRERDHLACYQHAVKTLCDAMAVCTRHG